MRAKVVSGTSASSLFCCSCRGRQPYGGRRKKLHTAQPWLSRQIRDLENEVGAQLMTRNARGIELTPAGKAFLDHARLALIQVDAAGEAARLAVKPSKPTFSIGVLTGHEIDWLPDSIRILHSELPHIHLPCPIH